MNTLFAKRYLAFQTISKIISKSIAIILIQKNSIKLLLRFIVSPNNTKY